MIFITLYYLYFLIDDKFIWNVKSCLKFLTPSVNSVVSICIRLFQVYCVCFVLTKPKILFRILPSKLNQEPTQEPIIPLIILRFSTIGSIQGAGIHSPSLPYLSHTLENFKITSHIKPDKPKSSFKMEKTKKNVLLSLTILQNDSQRMWGWPDIVYLEILLTGQVFITESLGERFWS